MAEPRDTSKLPKWAAQEIERLRRDLEASERALAAMHDEGPTNVHWRRTLEHLPLPKDAYVQFTFDDGRRIRIGFRLDGDRQVLDINGDDTLAVNPCASNSLYVRSAR